MDMERILYIRKRYLPMDHDFPFVIRRWVHQPSDSGLHFLHCRDFWKIVYVISGTGKLDINGKSYEIEAGSVLFVRPDDETNYRIDSSRLEIYNLCFLPELIASRLDFLKNDYRFFSIFSDDFSMSSELARIFYIQDSAKSLHGLFRSLLAEYRGDAVNREELIRAMMIELLIRLQRLGIRTFLGDKETNVVWMVRNYIDCNFAGKVELNALTKRVGLSRSRLCAVFRKVTGHCISDELSLRRLREAAKLLTTTTLPVAQICFRCGFNDVSLFYRHFHRRFHTTPLLFRRNPSAEA